MRQRRFIVFDDGTKVALVESFPTGNKHRNRRQPDGPLCQCGEKFQPICANRFCPGAVIPRLVIRAEKGDGSKRFDGQRPSPEAVRAAFHAAEIAVRAGTTDQERDRLKRLREHVCGVEQPKRALTPLRGQGKPDGGRERPVLRAAA